MNIIHELITFLSSILSRVHLVRVKDGSRLTVKKGAGNGQHLLVIKCHYGSLKYSVNSEEDREYVLGNVLPSLGINPNEHRQAMALLDKACGVSHKQRDTRR